MVAIRKRRTSDENDGGAEQAPDQAQLDLSGEMNENPADTGLASPQADVAPAENTEALDNPDDSHGAKERPENRGSSPSDKRVVVRSRGKRRNNEGNGPASYRDNGNRNSKKQRDLPNDNGYTNNQTSQDNENKPKLTINELTRMGMHALRDLATQYGVPHEDMVAMKKQEIIFQILKAHTEHGGIIFASGSLEILPDGYGFLRSPQNSYLPGPDDIYISPSQIRLFNLKTGDTVYGQIRSPKEGERFFALLRVETVNFDDVVEAQSRIPFDN
nr:Rho termination factor N-terminal domain-containing protein [Treponemataceae bacterium]